MCESTCDTLYSSAAKLMRTEYRTCFHTLYDENLNIYIYIYIYIYI